MRRLCLALGAWLLLSAGGPKRDGYYPLIGAVAAPAEQAVVLLLIRDDEGNEGFCTGTVIGARTVLTAAHCIAPQSVGRGASFRLFLGADYTDPDSAADADNYAAVTERAVDPRFDATFLPGGHDIGLLFTEHPLGLPTLPIAQAPQLAVPERARLVGYGTDTADDTEGAGIGVRRQVQTPLRRIDEASLEVGDDETGPCRADSGGPVLTASTADATETIVAVVSYSSADCGVPGIASDVATSADFILEHLEDDPPAMATAGGCSVQ